MDINHIHLAVKDLQNSMSFYSQNFGFQHRINHGKIVFLTNADGFDLALDPTVEPVELPKWFHFGCRLKSAEEVKSLFEKISQTHPSCIRVPLEIYDDFVFFRCTDPDGYALEVYWE